MGKYADHKSRWIDCDKCGLCETRKRVVLARGNVPCHVLFVGEAPGPSEDVLGQPFKGPAGHLLDQIVAEAITGSDIHDLGLLKFAYTNLVCCIPVPDDGKPFRQPNAKELKACKPRLLEFIKMAQPTTIVALGGLSKKQLKPIAEEMEIPMFSVIHPAAILRADITQRGRAKQDAVLLIREALERTYDA